MKLEKGKDINIEDSLRHIDARSMHETLIIIEDIYTCKKALETIIKSLETKIEIYYEILKNLRNGNLDSVSQKYLESIEKNINEEIFRNMDHLYFEKANLEFLNRIKNLKDHLCVFYKGLVDIYIFPEDLKNYKGNSKEFI